MTLRLVVIALLAVGCVEPSITKCPEVDCPKEMVCDGQGGCALPEQLDQCSGKPDNTACMYTNTTGQRVEGACANSICLPIGCGNSIVTPNEICDDGNTINGDGCAADCQSNETCQNGVVDPARGEQCDDGNDVDGDGCQHDCKNPRCGDGVKDVTLNEDCDAGSANSMAPDAACRPNCQYPRCGDGVIDAVKGEICDDGNNNPGDGCAGDCKSNETCGNNVVDVFAGEVCDDGNTASNDGCRSDCKSTEACGNGVLDTARGEVCDDGNIVSGDGCSSDCKSMEVCGNGVLDTIYEQCDLGAQNSNAPDSACRTNCKLPACGDGIHDPMHNEQCDDGMLNANAADACRTNCQLPRCGDMVKDTAEACDDGNYLSGDGCSGDCRSNETCGNSYIDTAKGEQCDAGSMNSDGANAPCRTNCKLPRCGDAAIDTSLGEACDAGAANSSSPNASCRTNCQPQRCADGILDNQKGEVCDDGNVVSGDGCAADCKSNETCGNGVLDTSKGEQCDAGSMNSNLANAPCRTDCKLPRCGDGAVDTTRGEACDLGTSNTDTANGTCRLNCQPQRCGDKIIDNTKGEVCDDGNSVAGDGCSPDCKSVEVCGNGIVDSAKGEQCDAGSMNSNVANAPCRTDCKLPRCGDAAVDTNLGEACDAGSANSNVANASCRTNCQPQRCGDTILDNTKGEVCDDGNSAAGDGCSPDCKSNEMCGNGIVDVSKGEQCDAGASNSNLANAPCRTDCKLPRCGDGAVDTNLGEGCDAGSANSNLANASCRTNCQPQRCGDMILDNTKGEVCDDGNSVANDGCSPDCKSNEVCGNGIVDVSKGEQCDAGSNNSNAGNAPCRTDCKLPKCGDGAVDTTLGESCDLGAANSNAANASCRTNCQPQRCGDGVWDNTKGEVCDDGNIISGDNCSADCKSNETCPNGIVDTAKGEKCDDGNNVNNDFCHNDCTLPTCGDGIVDFNEQCDLGSSNSNAPNAACRPNCTARRCGDQVTDTATEVCDDGNLIAGDGCRPDCLSNETCGNGILDVTVGEVCDDGNARGRDGCSKCRPEDAVVLTMGQRFEYRYYNTMAYDAARQRVVNFSGNNRETWEWDGASWTMMRPRIVPSARSGNAIAYDPIRKRVVIFGGYYNSYKNDTWEWDGNDWVETTPAVSPAAREYAAMAFDAHRKKIVLYGGSGSTGNETWEYDGTTWTKLTTTGSPGSKYGHRLVWDGARNNLVLYGGSSDGTRTWTFNGNTLTWSDRGLAPSGYPTGYNLYMAYDPARAVVVLWRDNGVTYEWNGTTWSSIAGTTPSAPNGLQYTWAQYGDMVYDAVRGQLVLAGGYGYDTTTPTNQFQWMQDTWLRTGTTWAKAPAWVSPGARYNAHAVYDPVRGKTVLFGGLTQWCLYCSPFPNVVNETWEFDGRKWTQIAASTPPTARTKLAMDYNTSLGAVMLFGGQVYDGTTMTRYADLYRFTPNAWTVATNSSGRTGIANSAMAYDRANNKLVTFGGDVDWTFNNDTLTWDPVSGWQLRAPATKPLARRSHTLAYDPLRRRTVLFGGVNSGGQHLGDVWEWDGTNWIASNATGPLPRRGHSMFFNGDLGQMNLHGANQQGTNDDLWEWDGTKWTQRSVENASYQNYKGAEVFDAARHQILIYGGKDNSTGTRVLRYRPYHATEACTYANLDYDKDGLAGCADSDCWSVCTPMCPPTAGTSCVSTPRCGDGVCGALENCDICPSDCTSGCPAQFCGDFRCSGTETRTSCPSDCYQ